LVIGAICNGAVGYFVYGCFEFDELECCIFVVVCGEMVFLFVVMPVVFDALWCFFGVDNDLC